MKFQVVTLFPEMVANATGHGVTGRGIERGLVTLDTVNPRDFTADRHRTVDDRPYGGGPGMVMKFEPLRDAIRAAKAAAPDARVVYLSPQGRRFHQALAAEVVAEGSVVLVCGRYEGVDERLLEAEVDEEWSIGDYVLSGGEPAATVIVDAVSRLVPGVLGDEDSAEEDSFSAGLLDCPHYTRPEQVEGRRVPEVLLGGDHEAIRRWRLKQSLGRTWLKRPDLIEKAVLDEERKRLLEEFKREHGGQPDQSQKAKGS